MAIEAVAAVAAKELVASQAAAEATKQLAEKIATQTVETKALEQTQNLDQLNRMESFRLGEGTDSDEKLKFREANAEEELKNKIGECEQPFCYDDNGDAYKTNDGELLPDNTYTIGGNEYKTNSFGKITECHYTVRPTPENSRDLVAQVDVGRLGGDGYDGGHLVARENGGAAGRENLEPMRATINRGEYRTLEDDENKWALAEQKVDGVVKVSRVMESDDCPSAFEKTVYVNTQERAKLFVDNIQGSTALLGKIEQYLPKVEFSNLKKEISEMIGFAGKDNISITSLREDMLEDGRKQITIGIRDELAQEKQYKRYDI